MILQSMPAEQSIDVIALLMKGGVVMIPLVLLSVVTFIIIFERMMFFGKAMKLDNTNITKLSEALAKKDTNAAAKICQDANSGWGRIFIYATPNRADLDSNLEASSELELAKLEKGLNYLSIIAGLAPLLGFVGTIIGVINIFFKISISQDISISVISEGLYQKMVTSASGLVVGIIAFSAYHLFQNQIDNYLSKIQEQALALKMSMKGE